MCQKVCCVKKGLFLKKKRILRKIVFRTGEKYFKHVLAWVIGRHDMYRCTDKNKQSWTSMRNCR